MSITADISKHLEKHYDFDPVRPSHLINKFGYSISLQGRDGLISATQQLYDGKSFKEGSCCAQNRDYWRLQWYWQISCIDRDC